MKPYLLLFFAAWPVAATSCISNEKLKACAIFHEQEIIFKGRLIEFNIDSGPEVKQWTLYRFAVDEAYKGLASGTRDVFLTRENNAGAFNENKAYLIYSRRAETLRTYLERAKIPKTWYGAFNNIPIKWMFLLDSPVIALTICSEQSRTVEVGDPDLQYLRLAAKGSIWKGGNFEIVAGQNLDYMYGLKNYVPVADALVVLKHGANNFTYRTDSTGTAVTQELPSGAYSVAVSKKPFASAEIIGTGQDVFLPPGGCAVVHVSFATSAKIQGRVVDWQGNPIADVSMDLAQLMQDGKVKRLHDWTNSDKEGRFTFEKVPSGRILVGVKIESSPDDRLPFDTTYLPGVSYVGKARLFELTPAQQVTGAVFRLPKPLPFGRLLVDVEWPNGLPAIGARAFAEWNGHQSAFEEAAAKTNRVTLPLALGRSYSIGADWIGIGPESKFVEGAETKSMYFTRDGQQVKIRLKYPDPKTPAASRANIHMSTP